MSCGEVAEGFWKTGGSGGRPIVIGSATGGIFSTSIFFVGCCSSLHKICQVRNRGDFASFAPKMLAG